MLLHQGLNYIYEQTWFPLAIALADDLFGSLLFTCSLLCIASDVATIVGTVAGGALAAVGLIVCLVIGGKICRRSYRRSRRGENLYNFFRTKINEYRDD